jgi:hypothetical protein
VSFLTSSLCLFSCVVLLCSNVYKLHCNRTALQLLECVHTALQLHCTAQTFVKWFVEVSLLRSSLCLFSCSRCVVLLCSNVYKLHCNRTAHTVVPLHELPKTSLSLTLLFSVMRTLRLHCTVTAMHRRLSLFMSSLRLLCRSLCFVLCVYAALQLHCTVTALHRRLSSGLLKSTLEALLESETRTSLGFTSMTTGVT